MSYIQMLEGLQKVKSATSWDSLLIKYKHKTHPNEFTCYTMHFSTSKLLKDTITNMCEAYLKIVDNYDKKILEYTGFNPKNTVDKLTTNNPLINECWNSLIRHINESDDTTSLKDIKANAFIFVGTYSDSNGNSQNLYLLARKNPVLSYKKNKTFTSKHNTISDVTEPLVQFSKCFDALIYNNIVYMINSNCESIFNMEYSHKKICQKHLNELEQTNLIKDMDAFRQYATAGQTPKKFVTYDASIVNKLKELKWQKQILKDLKIPFNTTTKQFDLNNPLAAKNFTLAICGKTKLNLFNDGVCEVPSSIPLSIS